jgi:dimethylargininase
VLLLTEAFVVRDAFRAYDKVVVDADEAYAANTLWVNGYLLVPQGFPKTKRKVEDRGFKTIQLDVSEMRKMDGGLTCLSLRF